MQVLISHLTRMSAPYICVAGLDTETNNNIRPVYNNRIGTDQLLRNKGLFDIGSIVELKPCHPVGSPPEIEDHQYAPDQSRWIEEIDNDTFWQAINEVASPSLVDIFGEELLQIRSGYAVNEGVGRASLGHFRPAQKPTLQVNSWGKIRMTLTIGEQTTDISVTDLRLYQSDLTTPRHDLIEEISDRIDGCDVVLSVGLARAFKVSGDTQRRHWLQINNIHLEDAPVWTEYSLG